MFRNISRYCKNAIPDKIFLELKFRKNMGYKLDLDNPVTFNEKLQWLKLYDRKPIYTQMVDKYEAKKFVASIIGDEYIIPTLGVWDKFCKINFEELPNQFVLKTTHDSGSVYIVHNKREFLNNRAEFIACRDKINASLKRNYYSLHREWPYKNVKHRIIAEKYIENIASKDLKDYKFFCFNGVPKCFKVDFDRFTSHRANYYDCNGNLLSFGEADYPPDPKRKLNLDMRTIQSMENLAILLSKSTYFLRTDFYSANGRIYFGELTFYPAAGIGKFTSFEADKLLGSWLSLK